MTSTYRFPSLMLVIAAGLIRVFWEVLNETWNEWAEGLAPLLPLQSWRYF